MQFDFFYAHVILLICRRSRPCIIYYFLPSKAMRTLEAIVKKMISKAPKIFILGALVPVTGLEPVRCCHRGILSPLRLPIPPHRRACAPLCRVLCNYNIIAHRCQAFFTLSIRKACFSLFPVLKALCTFCARKPELQAFPVLCFFQCDISFGNCGQILIRCL